MPHFGEPLRQIWVPYNGKIADITHADILKHFLDLEAALGETRKIIAVIIKTNRVAGTGAFNMYPNEGEQYIYSLSFRVYATCVIADGTQRLQYSLQIANDDWDIWCLGYIVEI